MNGSRARVALVLLNVALFAAIVYLGQHGLRRAAVAHAEVKGPLPTEYAVEPARTARADDAPGTIGREFDPPLAIGGGTTETPPPPAPPPYRLLVVSEDRADPTRSTAIVAGPSSQQRTVAMGDDLGDLKVVHIGVEGEGDERRATLVAEGQGRRVVLRTERGAQP